MAKQFNRREKALITSIYNAKQFHRRLKDSGIRFQVKDDEDIVVSSIIEDYQ